VPVYNIPVLNKAEASQVLVLDRLTMSFIFTGNISTWNDPRILALQTAEVKAKLQNEGRQITLVVRDDGSGSTEVFTKSLNL
jgi:ABC-type phosphate transport system substrate-binding protein